MKLGYACINWDLCKPKTFKLVSFSEERFHDSFKHNLECLRKTLEWNVQNGFFFFRISSDLIPFASHPVNNIKWWGIYENELKNIGKFIKKNNIRISMHPDQFVVINSPKDDVAKKAFKDLEWHHRLLDSMTLDSDAKIQIHIGGVYDDKEKAIKRFIDNYKKLSNDIKKRIVIENDEISYSLKDVLYISKETKIPVVFDVFHHKILNNNESLKEALLLASKTWKKKDGIMMIDYSTGKTRKHDVSLNIKEFESFIKQAKNIGIDFDIMLEVKDKEKSAIRALKIIKNIN
ncbi:MAG: UV DNA damage repair endonuclease UvsE [Candidatus Woesearchaeota archaeon]